MKALNLDFYGTLVDWLSIWVETSAIIVKENNLSITPKEFALEWRQAQRQAITENKFIPYKQNVKEALDLMCEKHGITNNNYHETLFSNWHKIQLYPETKQVLTTLKTKFKLGICTNSARDLFDIAARDILHLFDQVFISDETQVNKPHQEMYEKAIKGFNLEKEDILHVASSQMDLKGANAAGLKVCWINRLGQERLPGVPQPTYEISKLDELIKITL